MGGRMDHVISDYFQVNAQYYTEFKFKCYLKTIETLLIFLTGKIKALLVVDNS